MKERANLSVQFINPAESGATDYDVSPAESGANDVETVGSAVDKQTGHGEIADLITVGKSGKTFHRGKGADDGGKFLAKHELAMIESHADQIRDGLDNYTVAKEMHEAGAADSDIEFALAKNRLNTYAAELETAARVDLEVKDIVRTVAAQHAAAKAEESSASESNKSDEQSAETQDMSARSGESIDEYEARHGVPADQLTTAEILNQIDQEEGSVAERSTTDILDEIDREEAEVTANGFGTGGEGGISQAVAAAQLNAEVASPPPPRTIRERMRDALTPAGFATEVSRVTATVNEKLTRRKKVGIGLGILAVAGVAAWALLNRDNGGSHGGNSGSFWTDTLPTIDPHTSDHAGDAAAAHAEFSSSAHNVVPGEGWYQTFADMNIPVSERAELLQKVGPKLQEMGLAYPMGDSYGISEPGNLPNDVLQLIQDSRR